MLTTYEGVRKGGKEPEFNSLSYLGLVREDEWTVKIFSQQRISDEWLQNVFNGQVGWVYRKEVYFYQSFIFFMNFFLASSGNLTLCSFPPQHSRRSDLIKVYSTSTLLNRT